MKKIWNSRSKLLVVLLGVAILTLSCLHVTGPVSVYRVFYHDMVFDTTRFTGSCVGISTDKDYFLTTAHVTIDLYMDSLYVEVGGDLHLASVVYMDTTTDLALLTTNDSSGVGVVDFGNSENLRYGDKIKAQGYPGFMQTVCIETSGTVLRHGDRIWFLGFIAGGMSGGPLLNQDGKVIGLIVGFARPHASEYVNIAISAKLLEEFLAEALSHGERTK